MCAETALFVKRSYENSNRVLCVYACECRKRRAIRKFLFSGAFFRAADWEIRG